MDVAPLIIGALCVLVMLETGLVLRNLSHLRRLDRIAAPAPGRWPRVSVIMAARDEVQDVGNAVASRLADDYPDFEVVLVDDRSTDGTGQAALRAGEGRPAFRSRPDRRAARRMARQGPCTSARTGKGKR